MRVSTNSGAEPKISTLMRTISTVGLSIGFLLGFVAAPAMVAAEATISGIVRSDDGKALGAAVVTVKSGNRSISSFTVGTLFLDL